MLLADFTRAASFFKETYTVMKIHRILGLAAAVIIVRLAPAKLPFSNDAFGKIEGTYDFCAQANPQAAAKYQERKKAMAGNTPEQEVAEARSTKEYKDGYQWMSSELGKVPKNKAVAACKASLEDN